MNEKLKIAIDSYCAAMRENFNSRKHGEDTSWTADKAGYSWYQDKEGQNVVRIIQKTSNQRFAHSFIATKDFVRGGKQFHEGDILKTASWKTATFNKARGNVLTGNYGTASWTGAGYL
jgi:hypothetical protein